MANIKIDERIWKEQVGVTDTLVNKLQELISQEVDNHAVLDSHLGKKLDEISKKLDIQESLVQKIVDAGAYEVARQFITFLEKSNHGYAPSLSKGILDKAYVEKKLKNMKNLEKNVEKLENLEKMQKEVAKLKETVPDKKAEVAKEKGDDNNIGSRDSWR